MDIHHEIDRFEDSVKISDARTPPASWYREEKFAQLEKDSIFLKEWMFAGFSSQLKKHGDYFCETIAGRPFIITFQDDSLKAFYNVCSHHGTCVAKGSGNTQKLICPYHGWEYNLKGKLKKTPKAGSILNIHSKDMNLKEIPLKRVGPFLFLYLGKDAIPEFSPELEAHFNAEMYREMNFLKRVEYVLECNWKVYVDNYLDGGYHVPHMHPGLTSQLDVSSYKTEIYDIYNIQKCRGLESIAMEHEVRGRVEGEAEYTWVYPNFMVNRYGKWMDTNWAVPLGPKKCKIIFDYFHETLPENAEQALKASHQVQKEDMEICDMVQAGLQSEVYDQGVYAPQFEEPMYHFHKLLKKSFQAGL